MKFLLAAINAKYIHSNPGVYSLRAFAGRRLPEAEIVIAEYTINHQMEQILQDIFMKKPDFIGFSCYIWNISCVLELARDIHKVLPEAEIWLGGPEVSYDAARLLSKEPELRDIMRGEGELTFTELVRTYEKAIRNEESGSGRPVKDSVLAGIAGITYRDAAGCIRENEDRPLLPMDEIPFYYDDMTDFENRIVYYESSRGCPFSCSYCLSSADKTVRFRSLELVRREMDFFLEKRVPQVKFVDRTFNCRREHTLGIWRHILEHDNGVTNFHFEVSADLFDEEELSLIGQMRPGLIQLEIGVQSTNPDTIRAIRRSMDLGKLKEAVRRIHEFRNTHQHLDLIAGLPEEGLESFLRSFDQVYAMRPDQLQLGFLKVLKGSYMAEAAADWGVAYRSAPPYEVLETKWLSFEELIRLKKMEEMVEIFYNSGQFQAALALLERQYDAPSAMFLELAGAYEEKAMSGRNHSRLARYEFLYGFLACRFSGRKELLSSFRDALMFDLYRRENIKSRPSFAGDQTADRERIREFFAGEERKPLWLPDYEGFDSRQLARMAHMERLEDGSFLLFDYRRRSPLDHGAKVVRLRAPDEAGDGDCWRQLPLPFGL